MKEDPLIKDVLHPAESFPFEETGYVVHKELPPPGFEGTNIPYRIQSDNGVTAVLFICFFLSAYVLSQGKKSIMQQMKDFAHVKDRASIFSISTAADFRFRVILFFQTCALLGVLFFDHFYNPGSLLSQKLPPYTILGIYVGSCSFYMLLKWNTYRFLGWVFFDKTRTRIWLNSYSVILYYLGFALFPLALLTVYFDLPSGILLPCWLGLVIIAKILMFYKWLKLFFGNMHGILYLIVYFCALELVPCVMLYQGLIQVNNLLLVK